MTIVAGFAVEESVLGSGVESFLDFAE